MIFRVEGEPQGKGRPRFGNGRTYTPKRTRDYERLIKMVFTQMYPYHIPFKKETPLAVRIEARFAIPQSASRAKKKAMLEGRIRPTKVPDADNICKQFLDSLHGVCYENDCSVVQLEVSKYYASVPCVIVEVREKYVENSPK